MGNEMVEAVVLAGSKRFRHRLNTPAVTWTNEPGHKEVSCSRPNE